MSRQIGVNTKFVVAAILTALITMMNWIPYTGYIPILGGAVEMTTLHIVVITGSIALGWKYGAFLGGVWGLNCVLRALTNPLWALFTNPLISLVPRALVGLIAALIFALLHKMIQSKIVCATLTAALATIIHTALVVTAIFAVGGSFQTYEAIFALFKEIYVAVVTLNGPFELIAAIVAVPVLYGALDKSKVLKRF